MPAEILNRLGSSIPSMEASLPNKHVRSSRQTQHPDISKSSMTAMKFLFNLPIISIDYLHYDEKTCGLCHRQYDDEFKVCARGESPCCLPCGHIAGHHCLRTHLSPYEAGNSKCPFLGCGVEFREMFTEPERDLLTEEERRREVAQLENDSGVSGYDVKRFLSIEEVLARSER